MPLQHPPKARRPAPILSWRFHRALASGLGLGDSASRFECGTLWPTGCRLSAPAVDCSLHLPQELHADAPGASGILSEIQFGVHAIIISCWWDITDPVCETRGGETAGSRSGLAAEGNEGDFGPPRTGFWAFPQCLRDCVPRRVPRRQCGEPPIGTACGGVGSCEPQPSALILRRLTVSGTVRLRGIPHDRFLLRLQIARPRTGTTRV